VTTSYNSTCDRDLTFKYFFPICVNLKKWTTVEKKQQMDKIYRTCTSYISTCDLTFKYFFPIRLNLIKWTKVENKQKVDKTYSTCISYNSTCDRDLTFNYFFPSWFKSYDRRVKVLSGKKKKLHATKEREREALSWCSRYAQL
jgi:hypothetical protein